MELCQLPLDDQVFHRLFFFSFLSWNSEGKHISFEIKNDKEDETGQVGSVGGGRKAPPPLALKLLKH